MFGFRFRDDDASFLLLKLLLLADVVFVLLFVAQGFGLIYDEGLQISRDRSYGEAFQYVKQLWIAQMLASLAIIHRCRFCAILSVLFLYFLVDDYAELHENFGEWIMGFEPERLIFGIHAYHLGELLVFALYAVVVLASLVVFYPRHNPRQRKLAHDLVKLIALVAFFAVVVDALHAIPFPEIVMDAIAVVEDGGEMLAMSLIVWRAFLEQTAPNTAPVQEAN